MAIPVTSSYRNIRKDGANNDKSFADPNGLHLPPNTESIDPNAPQDEVAAGLLIKNEHERIRNLTVQTFEVLPNPATYSEGRVIEVEGDLYRLSGGNWDRLESTDSRENANTIASLSSHLNELIARINTVEIDGAFVSNNLPPVAEVGHLGNQAVNATENYLGAIEDDHRMVEIAISRRLRNKAAMLTIQMNAQAEIAEVNPTISTSGWLDVVHWLVRRRNGDIRFITNLGSTSSNLQEWKGIICPGGVCAASGAYVRGMALDLTLSGTVDLANLMDFQNNPLDLQAGDELLIRTVAQNINGAAAFRTTFVQSGTNNVFSITAEP